MTIELGWWLLPLIVTIISFIWANSYERYHGGYINVDVEGMFRVVGAVIISLIAWLIWALL